MREETAHAEPPSNGVAAMAPTAPAIERVNAFLARETLRAGQFSQEVLANPSLPAEEQAARLAELRRVKAFRFRTHAEAVVKDLDTKIATLRNSPASETRTGKDALDRLLTERRGLLLYLNIMFELRTPAAKAGAASLATQDTPGSATAPPTTPSPGVAQTPSHTTSASSGPNSKAPGSNGSRPC